MMAGTSTETPTQGTHNRFTAMIALDLSKNAEQAFDWYVDHLHKPDNYVVLVHIPELLINYASSSAGLPSFYGGHTNPYVGVKLNEGEIQKMLMAEKKEAEEMLAKYTKKLKDANIKGDYKALHSNKAGYTIVEAAQDLHADLIVMGTRGMGTVRRTIMGSVSDYVMHHSHVPVIVCRH